MPAFLYKYYAQKGLLYVISLTMVTSFPKCYSLLLEIAGIACSTPDLHQNWP